MKSPSLLLKIAIMAGCSFFLLIADRSLSQEVEIRGSQPLIDVIKRSKGELVDTVAKVIGGEETTWEKHKWQVALLWSGEDINTRAQFCGGSLIAKNIVLTAAHCVDGGTTPSMIKILSGTADLTVGGQRSKVSKIYIHKNYQPIVPNVSPPINDIALIRVEQDVVGQTIAPVSVFDDKNVSPSAKITVTGWGKTETGYSAAKLKEAKIRYVSRDRCNAAPSYDGQVTDVMLCAGEDEGGKGVCSGDSGGPATLNGSVIGIVSWGAVPCAKPFKFGVFTNVGSFEPWIKNCLQNEAVCEVQ